MSRRAKAAAAEPKETVLDLFAPADEIAAGETREVVYYEVDKVEADPEQPRKDADAALEASIKQEGVRTPISARLHPDPDKAKRGFVMIVDGERRYRGSIAAGRSTIPVMLEDGNEDELRRLVRQVIANQHEKVPPLQEAATFARIRQLSNASVAQLAKTLGKPKSTIADRLALTEAPAAFQALFLSGAFTAAAAPAVKKYVNVPAKILEQMVERGAGDWNWSRHIRAKRPVPIKEIENYLDGALSWYNVQEVPENLALLFEGDTFDVGNKKMTSDTKALEAAQSKFNKEQEALAKKAGVKKGEKPSKAAESRYDREQKLQRSSWEIAAAKRRAASVRFNKARPKILAAIAEALKKAPTGAAGIVAELVLDDCEGQGATKDVLQLLPVGTNADAILRHAAFLSIANISCNSYTRDREMPKITKRLGLNLEKLIDEAVPPRVKNAPKKPAKQAAKKSNGKKKAKR